MNDVDFPVDRVLEGIEAAQPRGLPVKVNCVVKRGVNDDQIVPLARALPRARRHAALHRVHGRRHTNGWRLDDVVPAAEIVALLDDEFGVEPVDPGYRGEVARRYRYRDGRGEVGVIASVTQPFCGDCTRARLSAEGQALHLSVRRARPRPPRGPPQRRLGRGARASASGASGARAATAIPSSGRAATADLPKVEMSYIGG